MDPKRRASSPLPTLSKRCKTFSIESLLKRNDDDDFCYKRKLTGRRTNEKFKLCRTVYDMLYTNLNKCSDPFEQLINDVSQTFADILHELPEVTKIGITVTSDALESPIEIPFAKITQEIGQLFENYLFKLQQSDRLLPLFNSPLQIAFTTYSPPTGTGFDPLMGNIDVTNTICINLTDNFCLFHSIIAAQVFVTTRGRESEKSAQKRSSDRQLMKPYKNVQKHAQFLRKKVLDLLVKVEIDPSLKGYSLAHAEKVQDYFAATFGNKFCILIFGVNSYVKPVFKGRIQNPEFYLPIFFYDNHFSAIKNLNRFCSGKLSYYYCVPCEATFQHSNYHQGSCVNKCNWCLRQFTGKERPCKPTDPVFCTGPCQRTYPNSECLQYHLSHKICGQWIYCEKCGVTFRTRDKIPHVCGERYCTTCSTTHSQDSDCFIQPYKLIEKPVVRYCFFDFECTVQDEVRDGVFEHEVNFACAFVTCTLCLQNKDFLLENNCTVCGESKKNTWSAPLGDNCIYEFTKWLIFGLNKKYKTYAFAHYGQKYDFLFVLRQLFEFKLTPSVIKRGSKFFEIQVKKGVNSCEVSFRDTYNFMGMSLEKMVESFNLSIPDKGIFPHFWNRRENYNCPTLPNLPPREFYALDNMSTEKKNIFEAWYIANFETKFFLPTALYEYGVNDVLILAHAFVAFRKLFMELADGLNPFVEGVTIPSACMKLFRHSFLKPNTIAIIPHKGYQRHSKSSLEAQKYFAWREYKFGKRIQHRNSPGGEKKISQYLVDGFVADENLIIEYLGCAWHSHDCMNPATVLPTGRTAKKEAERTETRLEILKNLGYNIERVYGCHVKKELKADPEMKNFFDTVILGGPIDPQDAFFGLVSDFFVKNLTLLKH